jgi:hypothetical protein
MKTYAIYRGLYGSDFVKQSIESVLPHVDKVIFVYCVKPWAGVTEGEYRGVKYKFPEHVDTLSETVKQMAEDDFRIDYVEHYSPSARGQIAEIVNEIVIPKFGRPDVAFFMHPDHVWRDEALGEALEEFKRAPYQYMNTYQVETWRGLDTRIPERRRAGVGFWKVPEGGLPETALDFNPKQVPLQYVMMLRPRVHNLRYSQNPNMMFWRHLIISAYVKVDGDSRPNPNHFEDKWLNWTPDTRDLEMSLAHMATVPAALPYDVSELPETIQRDLPELQRQISNAAWKGYPSCE